MHNEGLKHILNSFQKSDKIHSAKELFHVIDESGRDYLKNNIKSETSRKKALHVFSSRFEIMENNNKLLLQTKSAKFSSSSNKLMSSQKLTQTQKDLFQKMDEVIANHADILTEKNADFSSYDKALNKIDKEAASQLDTKKKLVPIVIATIVAKSSMEYWHKNRKKWADVIKNKLVINNHAVSSSVNLTNIKTAEAGGDPARSILKADAAGAAAGVLNSFADGTAEITEGGGAIAEGVAGALIGSAGESAGQLAGDAYDYVASFF